MPASRSRRFCQALLEETSGEVLRWATIADVARHLKPTTRNGDARKSERVCEVAPQECVTIASKVFFDSGDSIWRWARTRLAARAEIDSTSP
jgi:hypothetical protein